MKRKMSWMLAIAMLVSILCTANSAMAVTYTQTIYEAESAVRNGASTNTNHTGYTGTGFVDQFDAKGDYVQFSISVASAADYSMIFRYANAGGYYASAKVYIDGEYEATAVFESLANWDAWGTAEVGRYLTAGSHTVKIEYNNHAINLDHLKVELKHESTRSFYLSNQQDLLALWKASKLCSEDVAVKGPRLDELRVSSNWSVNQIVDYTGFFRDESASAKYNQAQSFENEAYFDENGILRSNYLEYAGSYPAGLEFSRDYAAIPGMSAIVTKYTVKNTTAAAKSVNVLDMLHVSNTGSGSVSGSYSSADKAIVFDRTSSGQPYMVLGAFDAPTAYQAANDAVSNTAQSDCSPWVTFDANGTLKNSGSVTAADVSGAFMQTLTVPANGTAEVCFYIGTAADSTAASSLIATVGAQTGAYWFTYTSDWYEDWFDAAKSVPAFSDPELALMYKRNLVMIKNSLRPGTSTGDGAHAATTNPYDYGYKVWTRDASVTALALDAAGFTAEGERYWRWLAARQLTGTSAGQFNTCIDLWTNQRAEFIEPEHDTIGWFLFGVYRHTLETGSATLRDDLWTQLTASADYVMNNIDERGFGPEDFSIWEDMDNYGVYTYTQALYVAGLQAMGKMALDKGLVALADSYNGAASTIKTAINRDDDYATGLWNSKGGYYDKNIRWDDSVNRMKDGAGLILFVTGVVDIGSSRAQNSMAEFEEDLASDGFGMARFGNDTYYSKDSVYSPSGDEAVEVSPSWPQISNWNAVSSLYLGNSQKALDIFDWHLHRTAAGYMVTGECVSDVTEKPCISTASEPVTAGAFILASLVWDGQTDLRIIPDQSNAGCYKTINVTGGAGGDWSQYSNVPYYLDERGDASGDASIKNVYISNDDSYLYLRIDNETGGLPGFADSANLFQTAVYFQDAYGTLPSTTSSINGGGFVHGMSYAIARTSDSNDIMRYTANSGGWATPSTLSGAMFEWQTTTGRQELKIPLSAIGITSIGTDTWFNAQVVMGVKSGGVVTDNDVFSIHYRLTGSSEPWLYGDFE